MAEERRMRKKEHEAAKKGIDTKERFYNDIFV